MTLETWLARHAYLEPLAEFHSRIDSALDNCPRLELIPPDWNPYLPEFHAGIPLLHSSAVTTDLAPAESMLKCVVNQLATGSGKIAEECRGLQAELHREEDSARRALASLLNQAEFESGRLGMVRYLGWAVLQRYLRPMVLAFSRWRDDEKWLRSHCPTCGSSPSMAQLLGIDQVRRRLLCCARCGDRWQYRRTGCPFCQSEDTHRLQSLAIEKEGGLRIDYCEICKGYLKTYDGEGSERVMLANWTSIHLDILARDRHLNALAESVYQLE
jgi:FdhE protein